MAKSDKEIKEAVEKARQIVQGVYKEDPRLKQPDSASDSGIARETDIVFKEVLRYLLVQ